MVESELVVVKIEAAVTASTNDVVDESLRVVLAAVVAAFVIEARIWGELRDDHFLRGIIVQNDVAETVMPYVVTPTPKAWAESCVASIVDAVLSQEIFSNGMRRTSIRQCCSLVCILNRRSIPKGTKGTQRETHLYRTRSRRERLRVWKGNKTKTGFEALLQGGSARAGGQKVTFNDRAHHLPGCLRSLLRSTAMKLHCWR